MTARFVFRYKKFFEPGATFFEAAHPSVSTVATVLRENIGVREKTVAWKVTAKGENS